MQSAAVVAANAVMTREAPRLNCYGSW